uniref:Uncharacterized protein n=1 Tax=Panagrolaimus davidi TaxID=227884 RepID=A0A914PK09_9BILA
MLIFLLLFLPSVLSNSTNLTDASVSTNTTITTTKAHSIAQTLPYKSDIGDYQKVADNLGIACYGPHESDTRRAFHVFIYQCLYDKKPNNLTEIEHHWNFCCRLRQTCQDGPSTDHKCFDIFCDCMDLVDLSTDPSKDTCRSNTESMEEIWGENVEPFKGRYINIYENVGFGAIYGKNLVFGTSGWICMAIIFAIFLSASAYLIISYIQFKCNKVTKEVIAKKEAGDEYYVPPQPPPSKKFHDKIILKA